MKALLPPFTSRITSASSTRKNYSACSAPARQASPTTRRCSPGSFSFASDCIRRTMTDASCWTTPSTRTSPLALRSQEADLARYRAQHLGEDALQIARDFEQVDPGPWLFQFTPEFVPVGLAVKIRRRATHCGRLWSWWSSCLRSSYDARALLRLTDPRTPPNDERPRPRTGDARYSMHDALSTRSSSASFTVSESAHSRIERSSSAVITFSNSVT